MINRRGLGFRRKTLASAGVAFAWGIWFATCSAGAIDWVSWTPSVAPATTSTGSGSGLTVAADWTVRTNIQFENRTINITEASWPFTNSDVVHMWLSQAGTVPYSNATIDFTNAGGMAAGGSIGFVDIDNGSTSFQVTAYVDDGQGGYAVQPVNWSYTTFQNTPTDSPPAWDGATNTISGTGGGSDVFAFLTSDTQIDRIVLNGQTVNDGWGFAATSVAVPEPSTLVFAGSALACLFLARLRDACELKRQHVTRRHTTEDPVNTGGQSVASCKDAAVCRSKQRVSETFCAPPTEC